MKRESQMMARGFLPSRKKQATDKRTREAGVGIIPTRRSHLSMLAVAGKEFLTPARSAFIGGCIGFGLFEMRSK